MTESTNTPSNPIPPSQGATSNAPAPEPANRLAKWEVTNTVETPNPDAHVAPVDTNGAETQQKPEVNPKSLQALAEKLGVEVKDLYDIEVPSAKEGESFTLGKLKDEMTRRDEFTARELQWEEARVRKESEFRTAQNELRTLLNALPPSAIKPEILALAREKAEATTRVERERTLEAIPEWKNRDVLKQEMDDIVEHLKLYGVEHLAQQMDHRLIKYLRENQKRERRLTEALALVEKTKPASIGKSRPNSAPKKEAPKTTLSREARVQQRAFDRWTVGTK